MATPQDELENYRYQLAQLEDSLTKDPLNTELCRLRADLIELISLTESLLDGQKTASKSKSATTAATSNSGKTSIDGVPMPRFQPGDVVEAKWSGDGRFYDARIEAVDIDGNYTVSFTAYGTTEFVSPDGVRAMSSEEVTKKRTLDSKTVNASATGTAVRKRKKQTLAEHIAKKEQEHADKQNSWVNFNAKLGSKTRRPAINRKSIFATSDKPNARVGVTGSGQGMTPTVKSSSSSNRLPQQQNP
jgi:survival-of-motor-neuron-related-splicing factor 30